MGRDEAHPWALRWRGIVNLWRVARGFSRSELEEVGLTVDQARRLGLPVDERRRSKHQRNVEALKGFLGHG